MGVNHLRHHAAAARNKSAPSGTPDSASIHTPLSTRPAATSAANNAPRVGGVNSFSHAALRGNGAPGQPEHGGARAGAKNGQPKVGVRGAKPGLAGGRQG